MDDSDHDEDTNDDYHDDDDDDDDDDNDDDVDVDNDDEFDGFDSVGNFRYEVKYSYPYLHSKFFAQIDNRSHWINGALLSCSRDSYYRYDWNFLIQFFF